MSPGLTRKCQCVWQYQDVYERSDQEQDSSAELTLDVQGNFRQSRWNGRNSPLSHSHALQWTTNRILTPVSLHFTCYLMFSHRLEIPHPLCSLTGKTERGSTRNEESVTIPVRLYYIHETAVPIATHAPQENGGKIYSARTVRVRRKIQENSESGLVIEHLVFRGRKGKTREWTAGELDALLEKWMALWFSPKCILVVMMGTPARQQP